MGEKIIRGISCPSCGGSLEIREGTVLLNCGFCNAGLYVKGDRGIARYFVPLKYSKEAILARVQDWFRKFDKAPDLITLAGFTEAFPVYVPFWRVNATVVGWVLGKEKKRSGKQTTYVAVERRVCKKYEFTCPACDIGEFGVKWIDLQGDEILPFDLEKVQREGMTFGILTSPTDVLQLCESKFIEWAKSSTGVDVVTFSKFHMINRTRSIVYYPLWVIRYKYKKRIYQITADAESSDLLYGRAPGNNLYRVACFLLSIMGGNFLLTSELRSSFEFDDLVGFLVLVGAIMYYGYRKLRYGGEVKIEQKEEKGLRNIFSKLFR